MKSYSQYQNNLNELYMKEYNLLNEETQQKIVEWNELDIESQQKIVEGLQNGNEEIISEWGELNEWLGKAASVVGKLPGIRTVTGLGLAGYRAAKGDWTGAGLAAGTAIPGPVGWGFVAADVARGLKGGGNKSKTPGQTGGGTPGQTGGTPGQTGGKSGQGQTTGTKTGTKKVGVNWKDPYGGHKVFKSKKDIAASPTRNYQVRTSAVSATKSPDLRTDAEKVSQRTKRFGHAGSQRGDGIDRAGKSTEKTVTPVVKKVESKPKRKSLLLDPKNTRDR